MTPPPQPLYLARESFRRRRAMDAARLLPFLGVFLFAVPRLWRSDAASGAATAGEGLYLFAVWGGLIVAAAVLSRGLAGSLDAADTDEGGGGKGG